jgi:hypothetical protein
LHAGGAKAFHLGPRPECPSYIPVALA